MTRSPRPVRATPAASAEFRGLLTESGLPLAGLADAWRTWVVLDDRAASVLGGVVLERYETDDGPAFLLRSLVVAPGARGRGLGRVLVLGALDAVAEEARGGVAMVGLLTETADDYFARFGFSPATRDELVPQMSASAELAGACSDSARVLVLPRHTVSV